MPDRARKIAAFLTAAGWDDAARRKLAGDASARSYDRLERASGDRAVLMDAPPDRGEDVRPFVAMARWLGAQGYAAPAILAADEAAGLLLLEDLGDDLFARVCARDPGRETDLYAAAIGVLADLHRRPPPDLPPYDAAQYRREAGLVPDWYLPAAQGAPASTAFSDDYLGLVQAACARIEPVQSVCVLRDYHAENLLWLPERTGPARVGLLDFQDALAGHPAYDLVSLLEDARRDTSDDLRRSMTARYAALTGSDPEALSLAIATLGAQRNLKIVGIFARLLLRDGKPAYLDLIPRVWAHLERDLSHPDLSDLSALVRHHVPPPDPTILDRLRAGRAA
jgi:aminoglycoside/choline kinase family phosphotransferase